MGSRGALGLTAELSSRRCAHGSRPSRAAPGRTAQWLADRRLGLIGLVREGADDGDDGGPPKSFRPRPRGSWLSAQSPGPSRWDLPSSHQPFHSSSSSSSSSSSTSSSSSPPWELSPAQPPTICPPASGETELSLAEQLRGLMRLIALPVVACTATMPTAATVAYDGGHGGSGEKERHGRLSAARAITISSFSTLTLQPTPVVSFNLATPSRTLDAVEAARRFNIHVLAGDAAGARVAHWLAGGNRPAADGGGGGMSRMAEGLREACGCELVFPERRKMIVKEGAGYETGPGPGTEAPVLRGPGILYVLRCRLLDDEGTSRGLVRVRDRVIVLGDVLEVLRGQGMDSADQTQAGSTVKQGFGLVYADRTYRQLGLCIRPHRKGNTSPDSSPATDR